MRVAHEQEVAVGADVRGEALERLEIRRQGGELVGRAQADQQARARLADHGRRAVPVERPRIEAEDVQQLVQHSVGERHGLGRRGEGYRHARRIGRAVDLDGIDAGAGALAQRAGAALAGRKARDVCGHRGMADEADFARGREKPQVHVVIGRRRRQYERRVGVVELAGDRLHFLFVQALGTEHDAGRIAREQAVRKDVDLIDPDSTTRHGALFLCDRAVTLRA